GRGDGARVDRRPGAGRGARQELRHLLPGEWTVRARRNGALRLDLRARLRARSVQHRRRAGHRRGDRGDDTTPMTRRAAWAVLIVAIATVVRIVWVNSLPIQTYFAKYEYFANSVLLGRLDTTRLPDLSPGYLWFV